ncbi:MAG: hypothetical protein IJP31_01950 [Lachnospiraceae bacterium]|nr:hypothetical protein [Lachnospiraceae bacterium]
MASEFVWERAIHILRDRVLSLGLEFVGEMVGLNDLNYIRELPVSGVINLASELGFINSAAKIVCVHNKKEWIAFICTKPEVCEEEIIRIYGKWWQIEVFFKTSKSYLQLISECHRLSYDALTAHVAIVFTRYLMIAVEQHRTEDNRTLGEIFYFFTDELADITFGESFQS